MNSMTTADATRGTRRRWVTGGLFLLLSIALLAGLLSRIHLSELLRLAGKLTFPQVLLLAALYAGANVFRALRLGCIVGQRSYLSLTAVSGIHAFLNHILPFRSGELSLPFLLKTFQRRSLAAGAISLVVVRLYDMISIVALMAISLAAVRAELKEHIATAMGYALLAMGVGIVAVFLSLPAILRTAGQVLPVFGAPFGAGGVRLASRLVEAVHEMRTQLRGLRPVQRYVLLPLASLLCQMCIYAFFYAAMRFMDIDIGFFKNTLASSGEMVTGLLPVNMIGSLGTLEAGWAVGYVICGIGTEEAIATGFIVHGLIILSGVAISILGLAYLLAVRRATPQCASPSPTGSSDRRPDCNARPD